MIMCSISSLKAESRLHLPRKTLRTSRQRRGSTLRRLHRALAAAVFISA
jgi:hypothetical protein